MRGFLKAAALAATIVCAGGAQAQAGSAEQIKLKPNAPFAHRHSKLAVPPSLAGLPRTKGTAIEGDQLDIYFEYEAPGLAEVHTVYIFRNVAGGLPVWFDRARSMIEQRAALGTATLHSAQAFVPPGRTNASGLGATYAVAGKGYVSTGVALVPLGEWMVKLRSSSKTLSPAQLDAKMKAVLAELRWPSKLSPAPAAVAVEPCTTALALSGKAQPAAGEDAGAAALVDAILGQMAVSAPESKSAPAAPAARWCRDSTELQNAAVYRADGATDSYLVALSDSGRALSAGPSAGGALLSAADEKDVAPSYTVQFVLLAQTMNSAAFDRLPPPAQALELAKEGSFASSYATWGKGKGRLNISSDAIK